MAHSSRVATFSIGKQVDKDTVAGGITASIPFASMSANEIPEIIVADNAVGSLMDATSQEIETTKGEFNVETFLTQDKSLHLLRWALGILTSSADADVNSKYTHTIELQNKNSNPNLYTIYRQDPEQAYSFQNGTIASLEISIAKGGFATISVSGMAKGGEKIGTVATTMTEEKQASLKNFLLRFVDEGEDLETGELTDFESFTMTMDFTLRDVSPANQESVENFIVETIAITGSITRLYDSTTFTDLLKTQDEKKMRVGIDFGDNDSMVIDFAKVKVSTTTQAYDGTSVVSEDISFKAFDGGDAGTLTIVAKNTTATY